MATIRDFTHCQVPQKYWNIEGNWRSIAWCFVDFFFKCLLLCFIFLFNGLVPSQEIMKHLFHVSCNPEANYQMQGLCWQLCVECKWYNKYLILLSMLVCFLVISELRNVFGPSFTRSDCISGTYFLYIHKRMYHWWPNCFDSWTLTKCCATSLFWRNMQLFMQKMLIQSSPEIYCMWTIKFNCNQMSLWTWQL